MVFAFMMVVFGAQKAVADIMIAPTLIVFEERDRFDVVNLINNSQETKTYNIGWKYMRMIEATGGYERSDEPFEGFDISEHIKFSPRRVTLGPNGVQKVRLALRRPAEVPPGDHHVHLRFERVPTSEQDFISAGLGVGEKENKNQAGVSVQVSYSFPIIARFGDVQSSAEIQSVNFTRDEQSGQLYAHVPTIRGGTHSVLGHLRAYHVMDDGSEELVGEVANANIFSEITSRTFLMAITKDDIQGGSIRLVLSNYDKEDAFVYDERTFPLN